eukprot:1507767-Pleurochrysis_carterae.AAC.1
MGCAGAQVGWCVGWEIRRRCEWVRGCRGREGGRERDSGKRRTLEAEAHEERESKGGDSTKKDGEAKR